MIREKYFKEFIPKSCMLPKTFLEYRTHETLQLPPKELGELCQDFQRDELTPSKVQAVEKATRSQGVSSIWYHQKSWSHNCSQVQTSS